MFNASIPNLLSSLEGGVIQQTLRRPLAEES